MTVEIITKKKIVKRIKRIKKKVVVQAHLILLHLILIVEIVVLAVAEVIQDRILRIALTKRKKLKDERN